MGWREQSVPHFKGKKHLRQISKLCSWHTGAWGFAWRCWLSHVFSGEATFSQRRAYQVENSIWLKLIVIIRILFYDFRKRKTSKNGRWVGENSLPPFQRQKAFKTNFKCSWHTGAWGFEKRWLSRLISCGATFCHCWAYQEKKQHLMSSWSSRMFMKKKKNMKKRLMG